MEMIKKTIGNAEFDFCVNYRENRSGFVHECELFLDGEQIGRDKAQYYNRTWEAYRFQSVMLGAVMDAYDKAKRKITENEMQAMGWKKLTQLRRNEIARIVSENNGIKVLRALEKEVRNAKYGTETEKQELQTLDCMVELVRLLCA